MKKTAMKHRVRRYFFLAATLLVGFLLLFVIVNLFHASKPNGVYALKDLTPASMDADNGYYLLMAITYPPEVDITGKNVVNEIARFSDPQLLTPGSKNFKDILSGHLDQFQKLKVNKPDAVFWNATEQLPEILKNRDPIKAFVKANPVLMKRYALLMKTNKIEEFSLPEPHYPLPNYYAFIRASNAFTIRQVLLAVDGSWENGTANILRQILFL